MKQDPRARRAKNAEMDRKAAALIRDARSKGTQSDRAEPDGGRLRTAQDRRAVLLGAYYQHLNKHPGFRSELGTLKAQQREVERFVRRWGLSAESIHHVLASLQHARDAGITPQLAAVGGDRVGTTALRVIQNTSDVSFIYSPVMTRDQARRRVRRAARALESDMKAQLVDAERDFRRDGWEPMPARFRSPTTLATVAGRWFRRVVLGESWKIIAASEGKSESSLRRHAEDFARDAGLPKARLEKSS